MQGQLPPVQSPGPLHRHGGFDYGRIPVETWDHIFRLPYLGIDDLKRISLSCRSFRHIAQSVLCEGVVLPILSPYGSDYKRVIAFLSRDSILGRVKRVAIGRTGMMDPKTRCITRTIFPRGPSEKTCPTQDQSQRSLWKPAAAPFIHSPPQIHEFISTLVPLNNLNTLSFTHITLCVSDLGQLLQLPNLTCLRLEQCSLDDSEDAYPHDVSGPTMFRLKTLMIINCNLSRASINALMGLLSIPTLRNLTALGTPPHFNKLITSSAFPSLLRLQIAQPPPPGREARLLSRLPRLKEFVCSSVEVLQDEAQLRIWEEDHIAGNFQSFIGPATSLARFLTPSLREIKLTGPLHPIHFAEDIQRIRDRCPQLISLELPIITLNLPVALPVIFHFLRGIRELGVSQEHFGITDVKEVGVWICFLFPSP